MIATPKIASKNILFKNFNIYLKVINYNLFFNIKIDDIEPFESLSTKLIAPYTKALHSVLFPISCAVIDRVVMSIPAPPDPNNTATINISIELKLASFSEPEM